MSDRSAARLGYQEAGDRFYALISKLNLDDGDRDSLIDAAKILCAWVAGADGRVGLDEDGAMFHIFWQDVRHETDFDLLRQLETRCHAMLETAFSRVEQAMTRRARELKAKGATCQPAADALAEAITAVAATVLAADRAHSEERARLETLQRRLTRSAHEIGDCLCLR